MNLDNKEVAILIALKNMNDQDRMSFIFDIFDKNNDKSITYEEFLDLIKTQALFKGKGLDLGKYEDELRKIFQYMDTSEDGKISKTEFSNAIIKDPSVFDLF
ncbi:Calcium-binding protein NCS-1 [Thelohanellus kitauei]|uniref:Calcium-binding protein NCS-1 n=1 Tax=Thelohanellus kitauei TaxID=669202 RepID=A0A0C2M9W8_THEKT|nr:Calcium-binding protein NCS-1 [Thelohanellus kitauei]